MKMSVANMVRLHRSLNSLISGRIVIARQNNQDVAVAKPFDISSDTFHLACVNINLLLPHVDAFEKSRREIVAKILKADGAPKEITPNSAYEVEFGEAISLILAHEVDIALETIELTDYKLDKNQEIAAILPGLLLIVPNETDK